MLCVNKDVWNATMCRLWDQLNCVCAVFATVFFFYFCYLFAYHVSWMSSCLELYVRRAIALFFTFFILRCYSRTSIWVIAVQSVQFFFIFFISLRITYMRFNNRRITFLTHHDVTEVMRHQWEGSVTNLHVTTLTQCHRSNCVNCSIYFGCWTCHRTNREVRLLIDIENESSPDGATPSPKNSHISGRGKNRCCLVTTYASVDS